MRRLSVLCTAFLLLLAGCSGEEPVRRELTAMDTFMTLTVYGQSPAAAEALLENAAGEIESLEGLLSVTNPDSEIYRANHSGGGAVSLSDPARELLENALALCEETGGALDVTVYPAVRAWGFTTGDYRVPEEAELSALTDRIDYTQVSLDGGSLTLPDGMELDLGSVAKGWTGDRLMSLFREAGVTSAIVELGGNVQALGAKPDGSPWRVAVQSPEGGYAGVLEIKDKAVVTSGGYQRYFEQDGKRYHHIIDPATGYPAESGLTSVTVVADCVSDDGMGTLCDAFSTALFIMGEEKALDFWREWQGVSPSLFDLVLITGDGRVVVTQGLAESFTLDEGSGYTLEIVS